MTRTLSPLARALLACAILSFAPAALAATTIRVASNAEIRGTNPGVNRDANTDTVMLHMIEGLVGYRDDGTPAPLLAQSVAVSKDGKAYTFKLRPGLKFHNGAPLTSADVVWSWKRYLDPNTKWLCLAEFDGSQSLKIESVEATDPLTVVFKLNQARPLFLTQMASFQCGSGAILHKDSVNADGSWKAPIGTGPFKLGEWKRGEWIELTAFKDYKSAPGPRDGYVGAKAPLVDAVRWIVIKDDAARRAALMKGQADLMPGLRPTELTEMGNPPGLEVKNAPTMSVNALLIQTRDPLMSNPKLRQALSAALNTSSVATIASGGSGTVNASMIPAPSKYHIGPHQVRHKHDVALAKKLLAEAGYRGQPIKMITNRRYPDMYEQAVMMQGMAKEAGINLEMEVLEWGTQLDRYQSGNYQVMSFGYSSRVDPYLVYESMLGDKDKSKRKVWDNPKAIAMLQQSGEVAEPAARQKIFDEMHAMMLADVPLIVLFNTGDSNGVSRKLDGFASWSQSRERLWGVKVLAK
jgi:peptide/nickel transport system substrate-binding protein